MSDSVWRRGFAIGIRVTSVDALAKVVADPAMMFLESVAIELAGAEWPQLLELLATPRAWQHVAVTLAADGTIALAPMFAALPRLEGMRLVVRDTCELDWSGCRAPRLVRLELHDVDDIAFAGVDLPALDELR